MGVSESGGGKEAKNDNTTQGYVIKTAGLYYLELLANSHSGEGPARGSGPNPRLLEVRGSEDSLCVFSQLGDMRR